ncbi:ATPase [Thermoplasmatales archaeon ex4484_6]|nr:MAG: ATPase [Thermoplasmatales archaeon ex4484_6]RLF66701.1 MAG: ATPase [Thermoplasmata archaeon]
MRDLKRASTGVEGLDLLLKGGFPENRVIVVSGAPGAGKTTLGVQFLRAGARNGEAGAYLSILEDPRIVIQDQTVYDPEIPLLYKERKLLFIDAGPLTWGEIIDIGKGDETDESKQPVSPLNLIKRISPLIDEFKIRRLVIDSAMSLRYDYDEGVARKELNRFIRTLKSLNCTTVLLSELTDPTAYAPEHFAAHGVIFMHHFMHDRKMVRAIQIVKMRGTRHDNQLHPLEFSNVGLEVNEGGLILE